jgi:hypothetical protein
MAALAQSELGEATAQRQREANVARLLSAMDALSDKLKSEAEKEGISLDELERMLDRKAR